MRGRVIAGLAAAVVGCAGALAVGHSIPEAKQEAPRAAVVAPKLPAYCPRPRGEGVPRAGSVASIFVESTVISNLDPSARRHRYTECSFDLVTAGLRQGKNRSDWRHHNPIAPFPVAAGDSFRHYPEDGTVKVTYRTNLNLPCKAPSESCFPSEVEAIIWIEGSYERIVVSQAFTIRLEYVGEWKVAAWTPMLGGSVGASTIG